MYEYEHRPIKYDTFRIISDRETTRCITLEKAKAGEKAFFSGYVLRMRPIIASIGGTFEEHARQLWFFRYNCIVSMLNPTICLDTTGKHLSLTNLSESPKLRIAVFQVSKDDEEYVLVTGKNTYIANELDGDRIVFVFSGLYKQLRWTL